MAARVVWINGAYGAGKTSVAARLVELVPTAVRFDPELLGSLLRRLPELPQPDDFQDLPLWRKLVVSTITTMAASLAGPLVVPMTVVDSGYYAETVGVLSASLALDCYFLEVPAEVLAERIAAQVQFADDPARDEAARRSSQPVGLTVLMRPAGGGAPLRSPHADSAFQGHLHRRGGRADGGPVLEPSTRPAGEHQGRQLVADRTDQAARRLGEPGA